ncbi:pathogenesis-related protein R minor form [Physcomitrium patens]|uniref:Uncharacterized protein n=1 Tax=Physcomitrium patens TaxID=3218 RepID=A0A2K1J2R9_PHYPA|nr:pathogenesis-related protein R minor form-like [Physcomitrium patens]PNR35816.1 hypothetical protein PHYPA_021666 [Physcomitrium patens]|eukprot:XP_024400323.1 pathogenesis-related protein R minor form-like [Physcomitrella patens]
MSKLMVLVVAAVAASLALSSVNGARIDIINQCGQTITACATCCGGAQVNCYALGGRGGRQQINVGGNWPAGVIWGFPGGSANPNEGNNAKPQANLAEFTIGAGGMDYYDISNVDAYNLPMRMAPTQIAGGGSPSGTHCGTIICAINDLIGFCNGRNRLTGPPGNGCKNVDGPGLNPTDGTRAFKNRCPTSYSYSKDDAGTVFGCNTGSNYEVVFCPYGSVPESEEVIREIVD